MKTPNVLYGTTLTRRKVLVINWTTRASNRINLFIKYKGRKQAQIKNKVRCLGHGMLRLQEWRHTNEAFYKETVLRLVFVHAHLFSISPP